MYKVTVGNQEVYVDEVRYVRLNTASNSYIQCEEQDAETVVINGTRYSLPDKPAVIVNDELAPVAIIEECNLQPSLQSIVESNKSFGSSLDDLQLAIVDLYESI